LQGVSEAVGEDSEAFVSGRSLRALPSIAVRFPDRGGLDMLVMFSARRLKPGAWEQFRRAWEGDGEKPPGFQRAYHARNIRDEDEIVSFGLFDMT
jgi:hypothetical protein